MQKSELLEEKGAPRLSCNSRLFDPSLSVAIQDRHELCCFWTWAADTLYELVCLNHTQPLSHVIQKGRISAAKDFRWLY